MKRLAAHRTLAEVGVIHRDISISNIFIQTQPSLARIIDAIKEDAILVEQGLLPAGVSAFILEGLLMEYRQCKRILLLSTFISIDRFGKRESNSHYEYCRKDQRSC